MKQHHLTVTRTARYYTLGELTPQTERVWFCLHGFGQLAQYFSRKFTGLDDGRTLVVVPEALSRFYLNGEYNRIGASWLTREDRDAEIGDFIGYLNALADAVLAGAAAPLHTTLLGFSQGAATACRWLDNGHLRADRLLLWAGYFPNGLTDVIDVRKLAGVETHYVYGRRDEYIERMDDADGYLNRLTTDLPTLRLTAFDGGHTVDPAVLNTLAAR